MTPPPAAAREILVVRLDEIGDLVMTTPFLRELRRACPTARITLVVRDDLTGLVAGCPWVDDIRGFRPAGGPGPVRSPLRALRAWWFVRTRLRGRAFDLAIHPRWDVDEAGAHLLVRYSRATARVGYGRSVSPIKAAAHRNHDASFTHLSESAEPAHEVQRSLDLLRLLGLTVEREDLDLWISEEERRWAGDWLARRLPPRGPGRPLLALVPGAGQPRRVWPAERFIAVARELRERRGADVVVLGSTAERALAERVAAAIPGAVAAAGALTIRQSAAVIDRCDIVVSNDTGPAHIAAAVGVPVVVVSCHPLGGAPLHRNAPDRFRPWTEAAAVLRPPARPPCTTACEAEEPHCIEGVGADEVLVAVSGLGGASER